MSLISIVVIASGMLVIAWIGSRKNNTTTTTIVKSEPRYKCVEVEVVDEMTKELVRNLYEEQEICNAKIMHLIKENKQYEQEIARLDDKLQENLESITTAVMIQPNADIKILKASYEESNRNIYKHKLKYEGLIIANQEKIVACKKKSNTISEKITKIGKEIYNKQMR